MRRAIWAEDESTTYCTKCKTDFGIAVFKHHCRKCGLIFCHECSRSKLLIPAEEIVLRPSGMINSVGQKLGNDYVNLEDEFRAPQRVCDGCSHQLRNIQSDLRLLVSRANQELSIDVNESRILSLPAVDFYLENEIKNATLMLHNFKTTLGEEKIPKELLEISKGVVFLTIIKCGFMFTGRYGTGLVVAKLPDGSWSAPSAVTLTGIGWGLQIGAEFTDVMLILSTEQAVQTFMSKAQVSVGAELGVSVGPIGRSVTSDVTAGTKGAAHAFSYAHSKGLFFGASLEASGIASRSDVNRVFYGEKVKPSDLLSGEYPRPLGAEPLYKALDEMMKDAGIERNFTYPSTAGGSSSSSNSQRSSVPAGNHGNGSSSYGNRMATQPGVNNMDMTPMSDFGMGYAGENESL